MTKCTENSGLYSSHINIQPKMNFFLVILVILRLCQLQVDVARAGLHWEHLKCLKSSSQADEIVAGTAVSAQPSLFRNNSMKRSFLSYKGK